MRLVELRKRAGGGPFGVVKGAALTAPGFLPWDVAEDPPGRLAAWLGQARSRDELHEGPSMSRHRTPATRTRRLGFEALEDRRVPAIIGAPWSNAEHLTLSFVPDGTPIAGHFSDLFRTLDSQLPTSAWQGAILR